MPEWLVERGIGETRAALVENGAILQARVELDGGKPAGSVIVARLARIGANERNALATVEDGQEYLLPRGAGSAPQGAAINIEVTREPIPGAERWKRPLARITDKPVHEPTPFAERVDGRLLAFPAPKDVLCEVGWNDLIDEARTGIVTFAGGELRLSATPAMTLIDVDGYLAADELALLGATEAAHAIRRLDVGGSIGIDLPTSSGKTVRQRAAMAIDAVLPQPFERTAVNGFGFVQIVRPRSRASLLELAQDRAPFEARVLLRRAAFERRGAIRLVAAPPVITVLEKRPEWLKILARQIGGEIGLRADPALPMWGGHAEAA